jgi:hypothetical protein
MDRQLDAGLFPGIKKPPPNNWPSPLLGATMLTQSRLKYLFRYDQKTGKFFRRVTVSSFNARAGMHAGYLNAWGYLRIMVDGETYFVHRLVWLYVHGRFPKDDLDHKNGIRSDNRITNLREATRSQNLANSKAHRDKRGKLKGVHWQPKTGKWRARIKQIHLGLFSTEEAAHAAYCKAAKRLYGHFFNSGRS